MAKLSILTAPDPRLKKISKPVAVVDGAIRRLMDDMLETMYLAPGIGLAAPQIGKLLRVIVLDVTGQGKERRAYRLVNPELVWVSEDDVVQNEGCLSLPEHYADVSRPAKCRVRYLDEEGRQREMAADGLLSACVQHEIDHLEGILFVDHITALKRSIILRKLVKAKKTAAESVA